MTVIGYTRLSQDSDTSIQQQATDIQQYCDRHGLELERIYDEGEDSSGFSTDRPVLGEVVDRLDHDDAVDGLVVRDLSRFSRDRKHRVKAFIELDSAGVELHSVMHGELDLDDPYALLIETARATGDDIQKREEVKKARKAVKERLDRGCHQGRPLFGTVFGPENCYLYPDRDSGDWDRVQRLLRLKDTAASQNEAAERVGVTRSVVRSVWGNVDRYEEIGKRGDADA